MPSLRGTPTLVSLTLSFSIAVSALPHASAAQERTDSLMVARVTPRWSTGSVQLHAGTAHLGLSELNTALRAHGRPAFSTDVATFGVSAAARFGRLVIGGSGESGLPQRATTPDWNNRVSFGSATMDAGVALVESPRWVLHPQLSLGVRRTRLSMERRGDFAYDDGIRDPARGVSLSSMSAMAGAGVVAELRMATRRAGDFSIGLRAGVTRPLGAPAANAGGATVSDAPREATGRYLRLTLGRPLGRRRDVKGALSTSLLSILTS